MTFIFEYFGEFKVILKWRQVIGLLRDQAVIKILVSLSHWRDELTPREDTLRSHLRFWICRLILFLFDTLFLSTRWTDATFWWNLVSLSLYAKFIIHFHGNNSFSTSDVALVRPLKTNILFIPTVSHLNSLKKISFTLSFFVLKSDFLSFLLDSFKSRRSLQSTPQVSRFQTRISNYLFLEQYSIL